MENENEIHVTNDYDMFNIIEENRRVDESHVRSLISSIEHNNILNHCPIIVNAKFEVIDGQHRLTACKRLGIPIYYVINDRAKIDEVVTLNTCSRRWNPEDFLESWAKRGFKSYGYMKALRDEYNVSVRILLNTFYNVTHRECSMASFKKGLFKASLYESNLTRTIVSNLVVVAREADMSLTGSFVKAFLNCLANEEFSVSKFLYQLKKPNVEFKLQRTIRDYMREIERVYNFHKAQDNHIRLF